MSFLTHPNSSSALARITTVLGQVMKPVGDRWGRGLSAPMSANLMGFRAVTHTAQQTGTNLWTPLSDNNHVVVTSYRVAMFGATPGRFTLWFGSNADTAYTEGTDRPVIDADLAVTSLIIEPDTFIVSNIVTNRLKVTTSAAMSVRISVWGYELGAV